jgi:YfiH family protein
MYTTEINQVPFFRFTTMPDDGRIRHALFGRQGGVSQGPFATLNLSSSVADAPEAIAENRRRAYGVFGRSVETLVHAHLCHGATVARVTSADHGRVIPACDGLITNDPGCGVTMNFADCGSVLLYDPRRHALGLGHAGWKGALADLPGALVRAMGREFGSDPADLVAALGPCISVSRYEVDEPLISAVRERFPRWAERLLVWRDGGGNRPIFPQSDRPHFNLALANHICLYESGVTEVELPAFCTASRTDLFFSHRAESGKTGRFGLMALLGSGV